MSNKIKRTIYKLFSKSFKNNKLEANNIDDLNDSYIQDLIFNTLLEKEPGPGYYNNNKSIFDKYYLMSKKTKKYNFGSNTERTSKLFNNKTSSNLGPVYDFKIETSKKYNKTTLSPLKKLYKIISKKCIKKLLSSSKSEDLFPKAQTPSNIGPGKYEYKSQFIQTQRYYAGPLEKRFFNIKKEIKPGPGEYLPLNDWVNLNKLKKTSNKKVNYDINLKNKNVRDYLIPKNDIPEVGTYNPQLVNSIEYNNICNSNKITNILAPFGSSNNKNLHANHSTPETVGPGSYIINKNNFGFKKNIINKDIKIKYNKILKDIEKSNKIKILYNIYKQKIENKPGPGTYDDFNSNWNKRSFNILYS